MLVKALGKGEKTASTPTTWLPSLTGVTTMERIPRARTDTESTRASVSVSSQSRPLPLLMHSPANEPPAPMMAPTSLALGPLRQQQTISSVVPTLSPMAAPEALANVWTRWAISVNSSNAVRFPSLLPVSQTWVAMIAPPQSSARFNGPEARPRLRHAGWGTPGICRLLVLTARLHHG